LWGGVIILFKFLKSQAASRKMELKKFLQPGAAFGFVVGNRGHGYRVWDLKIAA